MLLKKPRYHCAKHDKKVHPAKAQKACVTCPHLVKAVRKQTQREKEYR